MQRRTLLAAAAAALAAGSTVAQAQDPSTSSGQAKWPSKPITYIVPFGAGGTM
jgi:tripartite-type tricarboxylate transporter receptor subunit TctC